MRAFFIALASCVCIVISAPMDSLASQLSTADVQKALNAAVGKAQEIGVPMGISIVDAGGNLVGFIRMDGAFNHTNHTSYSKAYTSASIRKASGGSGIPPNITAEISSTTGGKFTTLPGGLPLMKDGVLVGAVGVGGGKGDQDEAVAKAAADALATK
jgi:glc operon protein GlcG